MAHARLHYKENMTRNILNHLGEILGKLDLPEGTSEEVWQAELAKYAAPPEPVTIPDVTPRQIRSALILNGITEQQVLDAFNVLEEPNKSLAVIGWNHSLSYVRAEPIVDLIGAELEVSSEWIDNLWFLAATL